MNAAAARPRSNAAPGRSESVLRRPNRRDQAAAAALPVVSPWLSRWFVWYCQGYVRRHFHALRLSRSGSLPPPGPVPLVFYASHASWWDPLVGLVLVRELFPGRPLYAPIDAAMLERYAMFARLGFFGVEQGRRRGAVQFLNAAQAVLAQPRSLLAITPQGRFADARERPPGFQPGLGLLARRAPRAVYVPVAVEYVFWNERLPEILVRLGEPVGFERESASAFSSAYLTRLFEEKFVENQDALAEEARRRDPAAFRRLLGGAEGQGGIYDLWRRAKAWWRREEFDPAHSMSNRTPCRTP